VRKRIREYSGIIRQVLKSIWKIFGKFPGITTMDGVLSDVLNDGELSASDDNNVLDNETLQEASCTDVEIISSIDSAQSRRSSCSGKDHEVAGNHANQETSLGTSDRAQL